MENAMTTDSQEARILRHLQTGRSLSPLIALEKYGCMR
jgi:Helix-turn-helix domain